MLFIIKQVPDNHGQIESIRCADEKDGFLTRRMSAMKRNLEEPCMAEQIEQRTAQQIVDTVKEVCGYNLSLIHI